jgi:hypothetical protein
MDLEKKFGKARSDFDFRKLIKIARMEQKSRNLYEGWKSNLEHFSSW